LKLRIAWQRLALAFAFAGSSVRSNSRRVLLAVLGVAFGIAAVTSMLAIGHSVTAQAERALARLGGDIVTMSMMQPNLAPDGSTAGASALPSPARVESLMAGAGTLLQTMPEVQASARVAQLSSCLSGPSDPLANLELLTATPELQTVLALTPVRGRFLHRLDGAQGWVVLGADAALELAATARVLQPGATLEVCGKRLRIAGVLARHDGDDLLPMFKINRALILAPEFGDRLSVSGMPAQLLVRVRSTDDSIDIASALSQRLSAALGVKITAQGARQFSRMKQEQVSLYTRFLAVLGGVALLVGSLGITNVMLVSVAERRTEIGVRAAIGARASDIALQFMIESVLVCLCGALLGLMLGLLGTAGALALAQIEFSLDWGTPMAAVLLALLSGLIAGAYPALQAARLDPVETLQGG
jgi:putative ABC transport system permease protein